MRTGCLGRLQRCKRRRRRWRQALAAARSSAAGDSDHAVIITGLAAGNRPGRCWRAAWYSGEL